MLIATLTPNSTPAVQKDQNVPISDSKVVATPTPHFLTSVIFNDFRLLHSLVYILVLLPPLPDTPNFSVIVLNHVCSTIATESQPRKSPSDWEKPLPLRSLFLRERHRIRPNQTTRARLGRTAVASTSERQSRWPCSDCDCVCPQTIWHLSPVANLLYIKVKWSGDCFFGDVFWVLEERNSDFYKGILNSVTVLKVVNTANFCLFVSSVFPNWWKVIWRWRLLDFGTKRSTENWRFRHLKSVFSSIVWETFLRFLYIIRTLVAEKIIITKNLVKVWIVHSQLIVLQTRLKTFQFSTQFSQIFSRKKTFLLARNFGPKKCKIYTCVVTPSSHNERTATTKKAPPPQQTHTVSTGPVQSVSYSFVSLCWWECGKSGCSPAGALRCSQASLGIAYFDGVGERMLFLLLLLGLLFVVVFLVVVMVVVVELSDPFFCCRKF